MDVEELELGKKKKNKKTPKNQSAGLRTLHTMQRNLFNLHSLSSKDFVSKKSHMRTVSY